MKFSKLRSSSVGNKDIGAFYGLNRTNRINDAQVSECKNMDCEAFPYFATRRHRELFYGDSEKGEKKMSVICHDTDIEDDYEVTGITIDGNFVYRGNYIECDGQLKGNNYICEYLGDYVCFPGKRVVSVSSEGASGYCVSIKEFVSPAEDILCDYTLEHGTSSSFTRTVGNYINVSSSLISCWVGRTNPGGVNVFKKMFYTICPGMNFKLKLLARNGTSSEVENEYVCEIPDDVYMTIDSVSINYRKRNGYVSYQYGDDGFYSVDLSDISYGAHELRVGFTARRTNTGEVYDISQHFKYYHNGSNVIASGEIFQTGGADAYLNTYGANKYWWNDIHILPESSPMLAGASYGGRLFCYDNIGVNVLYSSAMGKYDFTPNASSGGAGSVQCADHGKWTAIVPYGGVLYAFKRNGMYRIYSSDGLNFYMEKVADVGAVGAQAVCVVSDVMFFLSETGFYKFTGSYPAEISDTHGRRYVSGVLGGYDNMLYASILSSDGVREMLVYNANIGAYGVHDDFNVKKFVTYGGKLYAHGTDGCVYDVIGEREAVEFSFCTRKFFLSFEKKAINGLRLYFDFSGGEGEILNVSVSYDGGEWVQCVKPITSGKVRYVPIKFKKCDEFMVKVEGRGVFTLKGLSLSLYSGGDVKQNK